MPSSGSSAAFSSIGLVGITIFFTTSRAANATMLSDPSAVSSSSSKSSSLSEAVVKLSARDMLSEHQLQSSSSILPDSRSMISSSRESTTLPESDTISKKCLSVFIDVFSDSVENNCFDDGVLSSNPASSSTPEGNPHSISNVSASAVSKISVAEVPSSFDASNTDNTVTVPIIAIAMNKHITAIPVASSCDNVSIIPAALNTSWIKSPSVSTGFTSNPKMFSNRSTCARSIVTSSVVPS
mmetsp:Transcript_8773/g.18691  ORF Transcript_8773/g.18691 Transcript_8773/m.18691 type:complete len:240 (-) Transcript_8773:53-772(-)